MNQYTKLTVQCGSAETAEILMATLAEHHFYAFDQQDAVLNAYIKGEDFDQKVVEPLLADHPDFFFEVIEDRNWNAEWEADFQPVVIDNLVGIRAAFHPPMDQVTYDLIITPKMSFGTGHHATTCLTIALMLQTDFVDKSVLDFGTGTGVLAVLAEKFGAGSILAIDSDEWSVNNATENLAANGCSKIIVEQRNTISGPFYVDIILANINRNVLEEHAKAFSTHTRPGATLIISGILTGDKDAMLAVFARHGWAKSQILEQKGWLAVLFERAQNLKKIKVCPLN